MYARDVRAYLRFAGSADAALAPETLARFRAELAERGRHSPNTINRMLSAVKRLVQEAAAQAYVEHETAAAFGRVGGVRVRALRERLRPHSRVRIEPLDMRRVCELPGPVDVDRPARRGAAGDTGLERPARGRAGRTPCRGCRLPTGGWLLLVLGKGDEEVREAPLAREAKELIDAWLLARPVTSTYVFTSFQARGRRAARSLPTDRPMDPSAVWRVVRGYAEVAGLVGVKPHDFRRFVGTQLAAGDIRKAQKALGHKRIDTTARHYVLDELEPGLTDDLY